MLIYSCKQASYFEYQKNKENFAKVISCLYQNYSSIFDSTNLQTIAIFDTHTTSHSFCNEKLQFLSRKELSIVYFDRDSTVSFYMNFPASIGMKQEILMHTMDERKVKQKLLTTIKIVRILGNGWYELEKTSSLAD
jgi:hypothetical protein